MNNMQRKTILQYGTYNLKLAYFYVVFIICIKTSILIAESISELVFDHKTCIKESEVDQSATFSSTKSLLECTNRCVTSCSAVLFTKTDDVKRCAILQKGKTVPTTSLATCEDGESHIAVWLKIKVSIFS